MRAIALRDREFGPGRIVRALVLALVVGVGAIADPAAGAPGDVLWEDTRDLVVVRAYDAKTGTLIWQDRLDEGTTDVAVALAAHASSVIAVGTTGNGIADTSELVSTDFRVRAYEGP